MQVVIGIDRQDVGKRGYPDRGFGEADRQREAEGDQEKDQQEQQGGCNDQPPPVFAGQNPSQQRRLHVMRDYANARSTLPAPAPLPSWHGTLACAWTSR